MSALVSIEVFCIYICSIYICSNFCINCMTHSARLQIEFLCLRRGFSIVVFLTRKTIVEKSFSSIIYVLFDIKHTYVGCIKFKKQCFICCIIFFLYYKIKLSLFPGLKVFVRNEKSEYFKTSFLLVIHSLIIFESTRFILALILKTFFGHFSAHFFTFTVKVVYHICVSRY